MIFNKRHDRRREEKREEDERKSEGSGESSRGVVTLLACLALFSIETTCLDTVQHPLHSGL